MAENILLNKRVLVAEDNAINQMVVKHTISKLGAAADMASNGLEAIEKCKIVNYDLVLMDIQMPLMDGYEATRYIRNEMNSSVPIIAMTAFALLGEDEKCLKCGMNSYVSKPFTIDNLGSVIQKVLSVPTEIISDPYILVDNNVSIDLSMLYDVSGGDETYVGVMIQTFLENMPETIQKLKRFLMEENWPDLYQAAHYAKSTLSIIKINEMFDAVLAIELNSKSKTNLQELPVLVKKISTTFVIVEEMLTKKFGVTCN